MTLVEAKRDLLKAAFGDNEPSEAFLLALDRYTKAHTRSLVQPLRHWKDWPCCEATVKHLADTLDPLEET